MTREDIIRMAREAGLPLGKMFVDHTNFHLCVTVELERFAKIVSKRAEALEREACAKVCEDMEDKYWRSIEFEIEWTPVDCADAIRARGETK